MNVNPDHPSSAQAFTTFRVPARPSLLVVVASVVVLVTLWEAATATGSFVDAPGPMRTAVVVGVGFLALRSVRALVSNWRRRGPGPAIERIEP